MLIQLKLTKVKPDIINLHISIFAFIIGSVNGQLNSDVFLFAFLNYYKVLF